jgi:hypothetical protein
MAANAEQDMFRPTSDPPVSGGRVFCSSCRYDVSATIVAGINRCPECGRRFSSNPLDADSPERNCQDDPRYPILAVIIAAFLLSLVVMAFTS